MLLERIVVMEQRLRTLEARLHGHADKVTLRLTARRGDYEAKTSHRFR